jgi:ribonuclease-3
MANNSLHQEVTPYNGKNTLMTDKNIISILTQYDVTTTPNDFNMYRKAFINKSYCTRKNENFLNGNVNCPQGCLPLQEQSNERLEFLGDSVLSISVADYLFERYPDENEGFLTQMRTKLVNGKMLAVLSTKVGLDKFILISKQIEDNDGRNNSNILEDTFEAFLGAIYLDLGFQHAKNWVVSIIESHLDFADLIQQNNNFKDMLLKYYQQHYSYIPRFYESNITTTTNNQRVYTICIKDNNDNIISIGKGGNKKEAENDAAKNALRDL